MYSSRVNKPIVISFIEKVNPTIIFMISTMIVNAGNYVYNLLLGRVLGPADFAEAGLIVTGLLVFSFVGMTFQITAAKYIVTLKAIHKRNFIQWLSRCSIYCGVAISLSLIIFSGNITTFFKLTNDWVMLVFALFLPLYFLLSVKRGVLQGMEDYLQLSVSYQAEMWVRLLTTAIFLFAIAQHIGLLIVASIAGSVWVGYMMSSRKMAFSTFSSLLDRGTKQMIIRFLLLTAGYEVTQIVINYADMLLVKHYFDGFTAGLYTSMALIGRMIYFVTWMVVMVLIPTVLNRKKQGKPFQGLLMKYVGTIACFAGTLTIGCYIFPDLVVELLFGPEYMAIAGLLWLYALATSFFAVANIFVYYFLSMDKFIPVYVSGAIAALQVGAFSLYHESIKDIVVIQVLMMASLLLFQIVYFMFNSRKG